jgi:alpha-glucosidase (family GH31 glycosyl hydrolase)
MWPNSNATNPMHASADRTHRQAAATGALLLDGSSGAPSMAPFWDGDGAHVDFTAAAGVAWWQAGLRKALFSNAIAGVWNECVAGRS